MPRNESGKPSKPVTDASPELARRLGTRDATVIGLGSMVGAGVFAVWAPAAHAAGAGLLIGLAIAAVVAYCNAAASAQLAAVYPVSGGTYVYGRERLGPWWGYAAGWAFVIGKTASCAAMALTFATYAVPEHRRLVALAAVVVLASVNYRGITRTAALTRILVACTLLILVTAVVIMLVAGSPEPNHLRVSFEPYGVLQAAGLLFFAFAGYARIATMGEEVRDPARTIPRAITGALLGAVMTYAVVGITLLLASGPDAIAASTAPLATTMQTGAGETIVRVGAAIASLGALLALIAGIGRTTLAMARGGDLPNWLAAVHPRFQVPHHAEIAVAVVVGILVLTADLRGVIGFSSFGVLIYYAVANAAAYTQPRGDRRWPRALNVLGLAGCLTLAFSLPLASVLTGAAVLLAGLVVRMGFRRLRE